MHRSIGFEDLEDSYPVRLAAQAGVAACLVAIWIAATLFDVRADRVFDEPKTLALRCLGAFALWGLLTSLIESRQVRARAAWMIRGATMLVTSVGLLTASYIIASIWSIAPSIAWGGAYLRRQGTYTFITYVVFFLSMTTLIRTRRQLRWATTTLLLASVFPTVYALCQRFGMDLVVWSNPVPDRVTSAAGNAIFLGGSLLMIWPITLGYVVQHQGPGTRLARLSGLVLLGAQTLAIIFTGSVGVWLALGAVLSILILILMNGPFARRTRLCLLIGCVALAGALAGLASARRPINIVRSAAPRQISAGASRSGDVRLILWRNAVALLRERPVRALIGHGPDTIRLTLGHFQPAAVRSLEGPATADRSHNGVVDLLLTIGLLGVAAHTLVFVTLCLYALRRIGLATTASERRFLVAVMAVSMMIFLGVGYAVDRSGALLPLAWAAGVVAGIMLFLVGRALLEYDAVQWDEDRILQSALLAGIAGHYLEIQTGIPTATSELYFWLFASLIVVAVIPDRSAIRINPEDADITVIGSLGGLGLAVMTFDFADHLMDSRATVALFAVFVATTLLAGATLGLSEPRVRSGLRSVATSIGIWLIFLAVWLSSTRGFGRDASQLDAFPLDVAYRGAALLVGVCVAVLLVWVVIANQRVSTATSHGARRRNAPEPRSASRFFVPAVLFLAFVPTTAWLNVKALRADEFGHIGTVLAYAGNLSGAERWYRRAAVLQPTEDTYVAKLARTGTLLYLRGPRADTDPLQRVSDGYREAHRINPYEVEHVLQLAGVESLWADASNSGLARRTHLGNASKYFEAATRLVPRDSQVWNEWGKNRLRVGDSRAAVELFQRSLIIDSSSPDTHQLLGDALVGDGLYENALTEYDAAQTLAHGQSLPAVSGKALALVRLNRLTDAVQANKQALELAPNDYTSRKNLALLYEQLGDITSAASWANAAASVAAASDKPDLEAFIAHLEARARTDRPTARVRIQPSGRQ